MQADTPGALEGLFSLTNPAASTTNGGSLRVTELSLALCGYNLRSWGNRLLWSAKHPNAGLLNSLSHAPEEYKEADGVS